MYERFTDRARRVIQLANKESERFNHEYIGTEHILLGLVGEGSGVAATVLNKFGVTLNDIRLNVEKRLVRKPNLAMLGMPRAKKIIEHAIEEAQNQGHACVGTEHILVGLLCEKDGIAAQALIQLGLQLDQVRTEIERVLSQPYEWGRQRLVGLPSLHPIAERVEIAVDIPKACPKCSNPNIIRVLWHRVCVSGRDIEDFKAGRAILGSVSDMKGPSWVCLQCSPRWAEVHDLAIQDWELQITKEKAIAAMEFDVAARHRDTQVDLRQRLWHLVQELTSGA